MRYILKYIRPAKINRRTQLSAFAPLTFAVLMLKYLKETYRFFENDRL
jgi:hypothetical protein